MFNASIMSDLQIAQAIITDNRLNSVSLCIPLHTNWNLPLFRSLCTSDSDREVLTFLTYGWPLNRENGPVQQTWGNHGSANKFPGQVTEYLCKELKLGAMIGPFVTSPFPQEMTGISPMSTRPKKASVKCHIIVDLSWPRDGFSVNSLIPKDTFLGRPDKLIHPTDRFTLQKSLRTWTRRDRMAEGHDESFSPGTSGSTVLVVPQRTVGGCTIF